MMGTLHIRGEKFYFGYDVSEFQELIDGFLVASSMLGYDISSRYGGIRADSFSLNVGIMVDNSFIRRIDRLVRVKIIDENIEYWDYRNSDITYDLEIACDRLKNMIEIL